MANVLCIMGESGSGKTSSMRNLNPATTYYIDCDKKGLSWQGWKKQYPLGDHYDKTDNPERVFGLLQAINERKPEYKTVVIDTLNGIMIGDEMRRIKEKGYDKWVDLASSVYDIVDYSLTMRDDLTVIFLAHVQIDRDDTGYQFARIKTNGRKLEKIQLETKFPMVLYAKCVNGEYIFETQANNSTAKSPMGLLPEKQMPNDIKPILDMWESYNLGG
ncbi:MAG: ATP-binding protein [Coprobacillus sp.]|nr:ATP-binding protein [Coprobacillus sp.]